MATEQQPSKITDSIDKDTEEQATEDTQSKKKRSFDPQLSRTIVRGSKGTYEKKVGGASYLPVSVSSTIAPEIPLFDRQNWLIHLLYIRKDFETCKVRYICIYRPFDLAFHDELYLAMCTSVINNIRSTIILNY